jgi:hypothetical protein
MRLPKGSEIAGAALVTFFDPHETTPTWIDELRASLWDPNKAWSAATHVNIVVATRELDSWINDGRPFSVQHKHAWRSVISDFEDAVKCLGPNAHCALAGEIANTKASIQLIEGELSKKGGDPATHASINRVTLAGLQSRLVTADTRNAVWTDLVEAFRDPKTSVEVLAHYRDLFWLLLKIADYNVRRLSNTFTGVIGDQEYAVASASIWLGDLNPSDTLNIPRPGLAAGIEEGDRLELCRRLATESSPSAHHVIWLAFSNAHLNESVQHMGALSFYANDYIKQAIDYPGTFPFELPSELGMPDSFGRSQDFPESRDVVLVRVDLGNCTLTDPAQTAREQAQSVITLASFFTGETKWLLMHGYLHAIDGQIGGMSNFRKAFDKNTIPRPPDLDPMGTKLRELEAKLAPLLPISDVNLREILEAVSAWHEANLQSPLSAIILHVRVIELITSRVTHGSWYQYLDDYLSASWIHECIHEELFKFINHAAHKTINNAANNIHQEQASLRASIFTHVATHRQLVDMKMGFDALPFFVSIYENHEQHSREIRDLSKRLASPKDLAHWRDDLKEQWSLSRPRLQRIRNSLAHGGPIDPSGVETVHDFVKSLAGMSLAISLESILEGKNIATGNEEHKVNSNLWFNGVTTAHDTKTALFGN